MNDTGRLGSACPAASTPTTRIAHCPGVVNVSSQLAFAHTVKICHALLGAIGPLAASTIKESHLPLFQRALIVLMPGVMGTSSFTSVICTGAIGSLLSLATGGLWLQTMDSWGHLAYLKLKNRGCRRQRKPSLAGRERRR